MTKRSEAYGDYRTRLRQATRLLRHAKSNADPTLVAACSKGAVVLAAAALERYLNDAIAQACRRLNVATWDELSEGHKAYFADQMARRLKWRVSAILDENKKGVDSERTKLKNAVQLCVNAFDNPSKWPHSPEFGMFMEGTTAPNKINGILRSVHSEGADFFKRLENHPLGKGAFLSSLTELIDARHAAAHALPDRADPGPSDVEAWLTLSFRLVREIDAYLAEGTPDARPPAQLSDVGLPLAEPPLKASSELASDADHMAGETAHRYKVSGESTGARPSEGNQQAPED